VHALSAESLRQLKPREKLEYLELLEARELRARRQHFFDFYPDRGPLRRALYAKHLEFFRAGALHRERCAMAANRIGKTEGMGGYETTCHLTGRYPKWWDGRRFEFPISAWMAGKTNETTRDILQKKMFGDIVFEDGEKRVTGTGMIPYEDIADISWKSHDLIDTMRVKHYDPVGNHDGWSELGVKSYQQGRGSFEGTEKHLIWLDEEPEGAEGEKIYAECLTRTMITDGMVLLTFTPLEGLSKVVLLFMPGGKVPDDGIVATMDPEMQSEKGKV
jgi:phage terminase large subunit-like protein